MMVLLLALAAVLPADTARVTLLGHPLAGSAGAHAAPVPAAPPAPAAPIAASLARRVDPDRPHALVEPALVRMSAESLLQAERAIEGAVEESHFPGAALAAGRWDRPVLERGFGHVAWEPGAAPVDPDLAVYDIASLTKVVATTTAVMLLVEDGRMELDAPASRYLPEFAGGRKDEVTIRHLLTHTSGLPAWDALAGSGPEAALGRALGMRLEAAPGSRVEYSDVGFVVLWAAAERAAGEPLYRLLDRRVFGPLGMRSTTWVPGAWCERCVPTARVGAAQRLLRGVVHDPTARRLGGIAGNAGLFSTAHDLGRFAMMLASGGELDGVRVLRAETIREFARRQPAAGTRALGWDTPDPRGAGAAGLKLSPTAFGHTGFTGTSLWVDPERGTWAVLLTNRTYEPRVRASIQSLRRRVHDHLSDAVDQDAPDD